MPKKKILFPIFIFNMILHSNCSVGDVRPTEKALIESAEYDVWAGITPSPLEPNHKKDMDSSWSSMSERRSKIQSFLASQSYTSHNQTVVYPFSGIDVLNLFAFFPKCEQYVLFGLEDPGFPFDWNQKSPEEGKIILRGISSLSSHLAGRNYFTYRKMKEETKKPALSGAYPVFIAFVRRMGKTVIDSRLERISGAGKIWTGFTIDLYDPILKKKQSLTYFKIFLTSKEGVPGDGLYEYFTDLGKKAIFTKSAEYLFHGEKRHLFRTLLLKDTDMVVQDDSGFPLRFFPTERWDRTLYGRYERSWNLSGAIEPETQGDMKTMSRDLNQEPLPFPFGYGVLGTKDNRQSMVLVLRKKI